MSQSHQLFGGVLARPHTAERAAVEAEREEVGDEHTAHAARHSGRREGRARDGDAAAQESDAATREVGGRGRPHHRRVGRAWANRVGMVAGCEERCRDSQVRALSSEQRCLRACFVCRMCVATGIWSPLAVVVWMQGDGMSE